MDYTLREHTADIAVEATGRTLGDVFAAVANGMAAAMCDEWPTEGNRVELTVSAESQQALLFDYLDELIYERDIRAVLPVDNRGTVTETGDEWQFTGSYRGVPLASVTARDLKAVTYSEMDISFGRGNWHAYVVFDV